MANIEMTTLVTVLLIGLAPVPSLANCMGILVGHSQNGKTPEIDFSSRERIFERVAAQVDHNFPLFVASRYGQLGARHLLSLQNMDPMLVPLIVDPGIVEHLADLENYLRSYPRVESESAWDIRRRFRDQLGKVVVYRALALDPITALKMQLSRSLDSSLLRKWTKPLWEDFYLSASPIRRHYSRQVLDQGSPGTDKLNPLISVSEYSEVAIAVANDFAREKPGTDVYVFELSIPKLDLLKFNSEALMGAPLQKYRERNLIVERIASPPKSYKDDSRLESFVINRISGQEILSIRKADGIERDMRFEWSYK